VTTRERAAATMMQVLDSEFLRALTEPARLELMKVLLVHGPADIGTLASHVPQDRSVVSRHLKVLEQSGIVQVQQQGRHRIYALDGAAFVRTLEEILTKTKGLTSICCPPLPTAEEGTRKTTRRKGQANANR
jgi:DNA-binding transcriptional ArsR family regulator